MRYLVFLSLVVVITGCSALGEIKKQDVKSVMYDNSKSYAYNIASQTDLIYPYEIPLKSTKSPLRDFKEEEKEDVIQSFNQPSNAGSALILSAISLAMGNTNEALRTAGGGVLVGISKTDHQPAKSPRWIVFVEKDKFSNELEVKQFIKNAIDEATIGTLEKLGQYKIVPKKNFSSLSEYSVKIDDEWHLTNVLTTNKAIEDMKIYTHHVDTPDIKGEVYAYGIHYETWQDEFLPAPYPMALKVSLNDRNIFDDIVNQITSNLPKGFYLYMPPLTPFYYDGVTYYNTTNPLPTIYTQGKKYEFLKP